MMKLLANWRFVPLKPLLWFRIVGNYARLLVLRKPRLRVVTIALNYACQLSCPHCSAQDLKDGDGDEFSLSLGEVDKLFKDAQKCGAINIHFTGGEPLLYKDFYKIASLVDADRNILSVVTNGLLLAEESGRLKRAGFDLVIVSIDSPLPDVHDKLKGFGGAYQAAWAGVNAALSQGLKVMIAMVATRENLNNGEIDEQIRKCREVNIPLQILPMRNAEGSITREDKAKFYEYAKQVDIRWDGQSSYLSPRCLAARERLYVSPKGDVFPCDFIHQPFGNLRDESLIRIWECLLKVAPYNQKNTECLSAFY